MKRSTVEGEQGHTILVGRDSNTKPTLEIQMRRDVVGQCFGHEDREEVDSALSKRCRVPSAKRLLIWCGH